MSHAYAQNVGKDTHNSQHYKMMWLKIVLLVEVINQVTSILSPFSSYKARR